MRCLCLVLLFAVFMPATAADTPRSKTTVATLIDSHEKEIQSLYSQYLKDDPKLEGKVLIWVALGSSGSVLSAGISEDTTGGSGIANDLLEMVKTWNFSTGANETITFPIELNPPPPGAFFSGRNERTVEEINQAFESKRKTLNAFYDQRREKNPNLTGEIRLEISINENGSVTNVTVVKDEPKDEELTNKFIELIKECHLTPGPSGNIEFHITFVYFGTWKGQ